MKTTGKRILSMALVLCMVLALLPVAAQAEDDAVQNIRWEGDWLLWDQYPDALSYRVTLQKQGTDGFENVGFEEETYASAIHLKEPIADHGFGTYRALVTALSVMDDLSAPTPSPLNYAYGYSLEHLAKLRNYTPNADCEYEVGSELNVSITPNPLPEAMKEAGFYYFCSATLSGKPIDIENDRPAGKGGGMAFGWGELSKTFLLDEVFDYKLKLRQELVSPDETTVGMDEKEIVIHVVEKHDEDVPVAKIVSCTPAENQTLEVGSELAVQLVAEELTEAQIEAGYVLECEVLLYEPDYELQSDSVKLPQLRKTFLLDEVGSYTVVFTVRVELPNEEGVKRISTVEKPVTIEVTECPGAVFTDMPVVGDWAHDSIDWAVTRGITNGINPTTFGPKRECTRAQIVTFLWRVFDQPAPKTTETKFTDVKPGPYYDAILWAVGEGITDGTSETTFSPDKACTRAQIVTFLWRAKGKPAPVSTETKFTDVESGPYYDAILWAVENGITTGTSKTAFSPYNPCTRAHAVTFLRRAFK